MTSILTYNVKGIRQAKKRINIFHYLKNYVQNGIICLQETHSTPADEMLWEAEWGGSLYFSHGESNAKGVLIGISKNFCPNITKISRDTNGRILIIELDFDNHKCLFINFYNANTDKEQLSALKELDQLLSDFDLNNVIPFFLAI